MGALLNDTTPVAWNIYICLSPWVDKHLLRGPHPSDCSGGSYTTAADADGTWRCFHVFCNLLLIQPNTYESASVSVFYDKVVTNGIDIESSMPLSFRFLHFYQAEHTLN